MTHPKHIIVAGAGMGGTSWLSDILNHGSTYRTLFEPFHPRRGVDLRKDIYEGRYIPAHHEDPSLRDEFYQVLSGAVAPQSDDKSPEEPQTDHTLLQEIRIDLLLKWVHRQFPDVPLVYVVRHPAAVVTAQMGMNWGDGAYLLENMLQQTQLIEDYLQPFTELLQPSSDEFTNRLLVWCVHLHVMLRQFNPGDIYWASFEMLRTDPETEFPRLFEHLGLPFEQERVLEMALQGSPFGVPRAASLQEAAQQLESWQRFLTEAQIEFMMDTLEIFGLHTIYGRQALPNMDVLQMMLTSPDYPERDDSALRHWKPPQDDWFANQWRKLKRP